MQIQCVYCNQPLNIDSQSLPEEAVCPSCGGIFVKAHSNTALFSADSSKETIIYVGTKPSTPTGSHSTTLPVADFGCYELIEEIARGGMGIVYKARHTTLDRIVALKMIKAGEMAGEEEIHRFHAEAKAAAALDHSNIVSIYEVGTIERQHYFSMAYIDGDSLDCLLDDGPLSPGHAATLVSTIARAVEYAHNHGIIHRDLKPANVLIDTAGNPRVTDFGLAKKLSSDPGMTATGQVVGTPSYMPPEQAAGETDKIGPLADVYSLGALLYTTVTGRPPFQSANVIETLKQVIECEPVSPRHLNQAVDKDLETIILKCLEKDTRKRYPTALLLAEELDRFQRKQPILARPVGRLERTRRWCKRNRLATVVIGLVGFLGIASPIVASYQVHLRRQADTNLASFRKEKARADQNATRASERARQASLHRYTAESALAFQDSKSCNIFRIRSFLDTHLEQDTLEDDPRGFDWYHLWLNCCGDMYVLQGRTSSMNSIEYSRDGRRLAVGYDGGVQVRDTKERRWFTFLEHTGMNSLAISPDGTVLATGGGMQGAGTVKLWNIDTGEHLATFEGHSDTVRDACFSPDGKWLASGSKDKTTKLWSFAERKLIATWPNDGSCDTLAFSPDSTSLAVESRDVVIFHVPDGERLHTLHVPDELTDSVAYSPDGEYLATGYLNGNVRLWNASKGELLHTWTGHTSWVSAIGFSPDGKTLATGSEDRTLRLWSVPSGLIRGVCKGHHAGIVGLSFEPEGKAVVTASMDSTAKFWNVEPVAASEVTIELPPYGLSISDDRGILVTSLEGDTTRLIDIATGRTVGELSFRRTDLAGVAHCRTTGITATRFKDGSVQVWVAEDGDVISEWNTTKEISGMSVSPDRRTVVLGYVDGTLETWDIHTRTRIREITSNDGKFVILRFSPSGSHFASVGLAGNKTVTRLWDTTTWKSLREIDVEASFGVEFSPDGRHLAVGNYKGALFLWDVATGALNSTLTGHSGFLWTIAFSPDGKLIATGAADRNMKLWNLAAERELTTFRHPGWVHAIEFGEDGSSLTSVTIEKDQPHLLRRWNAATERRVQARLDLEEKEGRPEYGVSTSIN